MKITNVKTLQDRLRHARELRGLSQKQLAELSKCAQSAIGNVESGERKTLRNLVEVARALGVSADWLYDGRGPQPMKINPALPLVAYAPAQLISAPILCVQQAEYKGQNDEFWPFELFTAQAWLTLPEKERHEFENTICGAISRNSKLHGT